MSPEERELLNKVARTVEDNNRMLQKVRSSMRWTTIWRVIYWVLIIGISVGAFWFLQPYLNVIGSDYSNASSIFQQYKNALNK